MLKAMKLDKDAILPQKAHDGDAGFDLFALKDMSIKPNDTLVVPTGVAVEIPYGYYGDVTGKSGLTSKTQLRVQRGIVDFGYQGEIGVIVTNQQSYNWDDRIFDVLLHERYHVDSAKELAYKLTDVIINNDVDGTIHIEKGQKIAQMVLVPCEPTNEVVEIKSFSTDTERSTGGFGSTGLNQSGKYEPRESTNLVLNSEVDANGVKINTDNSGRLQIESLKNLQANGFIGG